ncbi:MAG: histidinol-phosphate transaminase [Saprospiraceae bacterium]|nr:histidinol-phosphate transaminase [Saprospiraceae bacterium]
MRRIDISALVRPNIEKLVAYSSARSEFTGQANIFLDANENPYDEILSYNRYPDTYYSELRSIIAKDLSIDIDQIMLTNGSDEGIDIIVRAFCEPSRDHLMTVEPGFGMFKVVADINDIGYRTYRLNDDYSLDEQGLIDSIAPETKLIFLCSPNNPTGSSISHQFIERLCTEFNGIVIIDEAYIEFSDKGSVVSLINEYNNLIITQTFSKALGAAGIRLGKVIADTEVLVYLNKIRMPYNISTNTSEEALRLLKNEDLKKKMIKEINSEKEDMYQRLDDYDQVIEVYPSDANFYLVKFNGASKIYESLLQAGVVVRSFSRKKGCEDCLRITIGTQEQNNKFYKAMEQIHSNIEINEKSQ